MTDVRWTESALGVLPSLSGKEQRTVVDRLDLVRQFPEMYPARQRGRFAGLRYFVINRQWLIYYRLEPDRLVVVIVAIVPALPRPG